MGHHCARQRLSQRAGRAGREDQSGAPGADRRPCLDRRADYAAQRHADRQRLHRSRGVVPASQVRRRRTADRRQSRARAQAGRVVARVTPDFARAKRKPRLLYLVAEDWYFCSHRLPLAVAAHASGFEVTVATRVSKHGQQIRDAGLSLEPIGLDRHSHNPLRELRSLAQIAGIYRRVRPDLAHHVVVKPVLYGSIAARIARTRAVVNAIAGQGYVASSSDLRARLLRPVIQMAYRVLLNRRGSHLIVQNPDDVAALTDSRLIDRERVVMIRGSGVDTAHFSPAPE